MRRREFFTAGPFAAASILALGRNSTEPEHTVAAKASLGPKMPIAAYGATGGIRDGAVQKGFNLLHTRLRLGEGVRQTIDGLNHAMERNVKALVQIDQRDFSSLLPLEAAAAELVGHEGLYGWIVDEPDTVGRDTMLRIYDLLKGVHPWIPFGVAVHWGDHEPWWYMERYSLAFDFVSINSYPLRSRHAPLPEDLHRPVARLIDSKFEYFNEAARRQSAFVPRFAPVWLTLQSYEQKPPPGPQNRRMPTPEEFRFWLYAAVTVGVRGFWMYKLDGQNGSRFLRELGDEVRLFREFIDQFPYPFDGVDNYRMLHRLRRKRWNEAPDTSWPTKFTFSALLRSGRRVFVVAVNGRPVERPYITANVGKCFDGARLRPVTFTRNVTSDVEGGVLRIGRDRSGKRVKPWEVFIFHIS